MAMPNSWSSTKFNKQFMINASLVIQKIVSIRNKKYITKYEQMKQRSNNFSSIHNLRRNNTIHSPKTRLLSTVSINHRKARQKKEWKEKYHTPNHCAHCAINCENTKVQWMCCFLRSSSHRSSSMGTYNISLILNFI